MESVIKNLDQICDDKIKIFKDAVDVWKEQYTGELKSEFQQKTPEMFTDRYGEIDLKIKYSEFPDIHNNVLKLLLSNEWIICGGYEKVSNNLMYISNFGRIYFAHYNHPSLNLETKYNIKCYCEYCRLSNDYIDFIKILFCFSCGVHYNCNSQEFFEFNNQFTQNHCPNRGGIIYPNCYSKKNKYNLQFILNENEFEMKTQKIDIEKININLENMSRAEKSHIFDHNSIYFRKLFDIAQIFFIIITTICNKYWNNNFIGQPALDIKKENDELKKQHEQFLIDKQQFDFEYQQLLHEKSDFEKIKKEFSDVVGLTKLDEERKKLKEEKVQFENEIGLTFIQQEKERLQKIKEQLSNMKAIISQDRKKLSEDIQDFETKKKQCEVEIGDIDI